MSNVRAHGEKRMTDDEFQTFLDESVEDLSSKQDALNSEFGIGGFNRWHFDQASERLQFFNAQGDLACEADVIAIGSFAPSSNTWKWAWANESMLQSLRRKAEPLKQLANVTGFQLFCSEPAVSVQGENMAWELAAMSVRHLKARGAYRAPTSTGLSSFLAITSLRRIAS